MKNIYSFDEGAENMKDILGGKGANLAGMTRLGINVPPGFTITTEVCALYANEKKYPEGYDAELEEQIKKLEDKLGKKFGDLKNPLLVSVRSGAKVSMPGMMDTVLNLGLNDDTVKALSIKTGNERFAYDCYRRFIQMFGDVVMEVEHDLFEEALTEVREKEGVKTDAEISADGLKALVEKYKDIVREAKGRDFPNDPKEQLKLSIEAVFGSWMNPRAIAYRRLNEITGLPGTAVNVQAMVFGNMGNTSGTGVAFTRDPGNGENKFFGEFLINAQGEDVVAGIRTPQPIESLKNEMPTVYDELYATQEKLENHYRDMQDLEFTIEEGKLYLLQTRNGKRTAQAAVKIAVDMANEGLITKEEALLRVDANSLNQLLHKRIDPKAQKTVVGKGLPASPGAACGKVVFTADDAAAWATERGEKVILCRKETSPEDITGMHVSAGILTSQGGMTSHAAVVCRGMGKCCVAGATGVVISSSKKVIVAGDHVINEGDIITINGTTGEVYLGEVPMIEPQMTGEFGTLMQWADEVKKLKVRTNADTPHDAKVALDFGAEGIGLCRTEHMFFDDERIHFVRRMILAKDVEGRKEALSHLLPYQKEDFIGIFDVMRDKPVTVRLLDPPLHEFLPEKQDAIEKLADELGVTVDDLHITIASLHEVNPMLGHRGCRLGVTYPEIYEMQVRAICEAAIEVSATRGFKVNVEIEVPLVCELKELQAMKEMIQEVVNEYGPRVNFNYKIGTMIELPRACLIADELAKEAEFMSFGTNDLTQTTFGLSRDDSGKFIPVYLDKGIMERDPAAGIDEKGVGKLMEMCVKLAKSTRGDIEIGICGEQGGDPASVWFCKKIGLDYVSCSPFRVPVARLAAAQAEVKSGTLL